MRKTTVSILLFITTMIFSTSVFANDISSSGVNIEPEYVMIAGISPSEKDSVAVEYTNGYTFNVIDVIEVVPINMVMLKPDKEINFNQPLKMLNDAKMQNQNFDRVRFI